MLPCCVALKKNVANHLARNIAFKMMLHETICNIYFSSTEGSNVGQYCKHLKSCNNVVTLRYARNRKKGIALKGNTLKDITQKVITQGGIT